MKNNKSKSLLVLIGLLIAVVGFCYLGYKSVSQIKLGLDLAGGVSITYQAKDENPSAEDMSDTIYKLQQRVQSYSTEAEVYQEGVNRINIDIPGVSDANTILEDLGKPGSLVFKGPDGSTILNGTEVASAKAGITDNNGQKAYVVQLTFTDQGTKEFADATTKNVGKQIAIVYDNVMYSNPVVKEAITGGSCTIDGMETYEEAENLASTIRIGSLSLELEELRSNVVGAKLGQEAISTSLKAGAIGFAILALFMLGAYLLPGLAAVLALILYSSVMICVLAAFNVTLTLPGIAGIVLSVGMAVDANVIIFTRIKEEIGNGKVVNSAIKTGFQKALSAIVDGNVTTLIAAAVLFLRGSGTVKGFATTLGIGVVLSMLTALFITKAFIYAFFGIGAENPKLYGSKKDSKIYNFVGKKNICFAISIAIILSGFVGMFVNQAQIGSPFNFGIDFKGGTSTNVTFNEDMSLEDISSKVVPVVEGITKEAGTQTQKVNGSNEVIIKTRTLSVDERQELDKQLSSTFGIDEEKITAESISGAVSSEMKRDAVIATFIATILMLLYIWIRFKDIKIASSAVIALLHDVLIVITFYSLAKWSVGSTFIAVLLTILGYSINSTIVIFDRIRENLTNFPKTMERKELINISISQTLSRSINTSLTTFIMIFVLFIMGVSSIREFALPIMVGIVGGTYSSVCISGSVWYTLTKYFDKKKAATVATKKTTEPVKKSGKQKPKQVK